MLYYDVELVLLYQEFTLHINTCYDRSSTLKFILSKVRNMN